MRVLLAPMEGVLDPLVRDLLTAINHYDLCITEFIRVVDSLLPPKAFYRLCPELHTQSRTQSGTLVRVQLLGQNPQWLAENAFRAVSLGSWGVDLNCGCPSKTVNGNGGGASLLKQPETIYQATKAMRRADKINWQAIGEIRQKLTIPVIANGEIWCREDAIFCLKITGCDAIMIGRGAMHTPNLSNVIKGIEEKMPWSQVIQLLKRYIRLEKQGDTTYYHASRIKQWLGYLRKEYQDADALFSQIRTLKTSPEIAKIIEAL